RCAFHGAPAVHQLGIVVRNEKIITPAVVGALLNQIVIPRLQGLHTTFDVEDLRYGLIVNEEHWRLRSAASCSLPFSYFAEKDYLQGKKPCKMSRKRAVTRSFAVTG